MFTSNIKKLSNIIPAGTVLLIMAFPLYVTQAQAETETGGTAAFSLAEVTLEPGAKLWHGLVIERSQG